jgi:hypothetical protein
MRCKLWYCLADKQTKALTIAFHLWLRRVHSGTKLRIFLQVCRFHRGGTKMERLFALLDRLFALWLQHVRNQICERILNACRLFFVSSDD